MLRLGSSVVVLYLLMLFCLSESRRNCERAVITKLSARSMMAHLTDYKFYLLYWNKAQIQILALLAYIAHHPRFPRRNSLTCYLKNFPFYAEIKVYYGFFHRKVGSTPRWWEDYLTICARITVYSSSFRIVKEKAV